MYSLITRLLALFTLVLSVAAAPIAQEGTSEGDLPSKVTITGISFAGSGCGAGTVSGMIEPDFTSITLLFSEYVASAGPDIPIKENRKNCNLIIGFDYTPGWKYALFSTQYRGYLKLDQDVSATQKSEYWFDGEDKTPWESTWWGPTEQDYDFTDDLEREPTAWSPCDGSSNNLYINTQVRVNNQHNLSGSGLITTDSITQRVTHVYGVRWERC